MRNAESIHQIRVYEQNNSLGVMILTVFKLPRHNPVARHLDRMCEGHIWRCLLVVERYHRLDLGINNSGVWLELRFVSRENWTSWRKRTTFEVKLLLLFESRLTIRIILPLVYLLSLQVKARLLCLSCGNPT